MQNKTLLSVIILSAAIALAGYFVGNLQRNAKAFDRYVEVKGLSEKEVPANLAVWPLQITVTGNDLKELMEEIDGQKARVLAFFKDQGFESEALSNGITNIQDARTELYGDYTQSRPYRYIARSEFTVRTHEIEKLQNALSASIDLIASGILIGSKNTWSPIEYIFTDLNSIKPEMVEEATRKAREVAEKFAQDSNSKVGKIKSAQQGLFSIQNRDQNTPHIKTVRVVTTVNYFLED